MKNYGTYGGFRARGKLGNVIIAQENKGRQCVRTYFKPRNPRTKKQQDRRELFRQSAKEYKNLPEIEKDPWREEAQEKQTTPTALYFVFYLEKSGLLAYLAVAICGYARLNRKEV